VTTRTASVPYGPATNASGEIYYEVDEDFVDIAAILSDGTTGTGVKWVEFVKEGFGPSGPFEDFTNEKHENPWSPFVLGIGPLPSAEFITFTINAKDEAGNLNSVSFILRYMVATEDVIIGQGFVEPNLAVTIGAGLDGTYIHLPEGAVNRRTLISIRLVSERETPEFNDSSLPGCVRGTPFARRFTPEDLVTLEWVTVCIPYNQGWIDAKNAAGTDIDESELALFAWDGMNWNRVSEPSDLDTSNDTICTRVNHLGLFRIMEDTRADITVFDMYLTNNPFSPNGDGRRDSTVFVYELPAVGTVTIKVYDLAGDLVKVLADGIEDQDAGYHEVTWTGENDFGNYVGSGIYIFKLYVDYGANSNTVIKPVGVIK